MKILKFFFLICLYFYISNLFSQTWGDTQFDMERKWIVESRIKKISEGNYSYKLRFTTFEGKEVGIGIGEIKRIEKRTDDKFKVSDGNKFKFQELCNYSLAVKGNGKDVTLKGKCVLLHQNRFIEGDDKKLVENYGIIMFEWDEFDEKVDYDEPTHHKLMK